MQCAQETPIGNKCELIGLGYVRSESVECLGMSKPSIEKVSTVDRMKQNTWSGKYQYATLNFAVNLKTASK